MLVALKILLYILLIIVVIVCIAYIIESNIKKYTHDTIIVNNTKLSELQEPVTDMYLCMCKLVALCNSKYSTHWLIVVKTTSGKYFSITSSRNISMYINKVEFRDNNRFYDPYWNDTFTINNIYKVKEENVNPYMIATEELNYMETHNNGKYNLTKQNCHHLVSWVIEKYTGNKVETFKGSEYRKIIVSDVLTGPKVLL